MTNRHAAPPPEAEKRSPGSPVSLLLVWAATFAAVLGGRLVVSLALGQRIQVTTSALLFAAGLATVFTVGRFLSSR